MSNWRKVTDFLEQPFDAKRIVEKIKENGIRDIYTDSVHIADDSVVFLTREDEDKRLVIIGNGSIIEKFSGIVETVEAYKIKVCPLNHCNCMSLREIFPFTAPTAVLENDITIGLGDRLGLASAGHIRLIKNYNVKPILAQQSIRELDLTGRTYVGVLDDASWAVFQEGYTGGFGADGDHLKKPEEVQMALDCGFTMITLDCSEHIDNDIPNLTVDEINQKYSSICEGKRKRFEESYLNKVFELKKGLEISFEPFELKKTVLIYQKAIDFAIDIYNSFIKDCKMEVDFEVSIDETLTSTSPQAHFFVASELISSKVKVATIAPRFCGEFQKGIDYIGDITEFEKEFKVHVAIADKFGYKISVHSGSDKFGVFPIVGKETRGRYHLKTAGTNWLEAVRVIAQEQPDLYREIHSFALEVLDEAKKYYHIGADTKNIASLDSLSDAALPDLMNKVDSRQVIHITYGLILQAKDDNGKYIFRDRILNALYKYEDEYYNALSKHIGKHISKLGI